MNKKIRLMRGLPQGLLAALSLFSLAQSAFALPEAPSITRTVIEVEEKAGVVGDNATYARPQIPVNHTTGDGRVGIDMKPYTATGQVEFYLYRPEAITHPFTDATTTDGPVDIMWEGKLEVDRNKFIDLIGPSDETPSFSADIRHVTLIDKTREFEDDPSYTNNPHNDNGDDVYELLVYATADWAYYDGRMDRPKSERYGFLKMQTTPVTVVVSNPKTASAYISSVTVHEGPSDKKVSGDYVKRPRLFENKFTNDGKLMVARVGIFTVEDPTYYAPDGKPGDPLASTNFMDVVYAYSSDGSLDGTDGINGGIDGFDNIIPISYAPYDPRLNGKYLNDNDPETEGEFYPFAAYPFRDGSGTIITKGSDFGGSYPWIDTDGRTLAMSTVRATLNENNTTPRYPNDPAYSGLTPDLDEDPGPFQGQSMVGLWTQGKLVAIDNSLNNTDFGIGVELDKQRMVTLYQPAPNYPDGKVQVGSGRENDNYQLNGGAGNTTFFDSIENRFNFNDHLKPVMPRDVVWWVSNGKSTAQFAFDDYLNKDSFIVSKMTGALEFDDVDTGSARFTYFDGWDDVNDVFTGEVRVANDACAVGDLVKDEVTLNINASSPIIARWNIPENGLVTFSGATRSRLEPIANGGIEGKGMWLESDMSIEYTIPTQPTNSSVAATSWYYGIFVDSREDSTGERRLITFPDDSSINLVGRSTLRLRNTTGGTFTGNEFTLPGVWNRNEWAHLGFQLQASDDGAGGFTYALDFYHNGFLAYSVDLPEALFQMIPGTLRVGDAPGVVGHTGWYDDFKVFAQNFDPEVCANLARGTLVGFNSGDNAAMEARAALYAGSGGYDYIQNMLYHSGQEAHTDQYYAVHYDYTTHDGAHLGNIPAGTTSIREQIVFPEAPLFRNTHRPDSSMNAFCFSCHDNTTPAVGLQMSALDLDAGTTAQNDLRRQPTQPLRRVFGHIPMDWISPGNPSDSIDAGAAGVLIDDYVLSAQGAGARTAYTLSFIAADGFEEELESDYSGTYNASAQIRANLDAGQGSVRFTVTLAGGSPVVTDVAEAPYAIPVPGVGTYTIVAEPFTDFGGQIGYYPGIAKTLTNVTFGSGGVGIPIGQTIVLSSADEGLYVNVDGGQSNRIEANVSPPVSGTSQHFEVVDAGGGYIALRSVSSGNYVAVDAADSQRRMYANGTSLSDLNALFTWNVVDGDTVRLTNMAEDNDVHHAGTQDILRARFTTDGTALYEWDWALVTP